MLSDVVGRRTLAASLNMTERVLRAETDLLKAQGLIEIESVGMKVSKAGLDLLEQLEPIANNLFGLSQLEDQIRQAYGLRKVVVVPGDSDVSPLTKQELGRAGAKALLSVMDDEDVVAVTGGTTIADVAEQLALPSNEHIRVGGLYRHAGVWEKAWKCIPTQLLPQWLARSALNTVCSMYRICSAIMLTTPCLKIRTFRIY